METGYVKLDAASLYAWPIVLKSGVLLSPQPDGKLIGIAYDRKYALTKLEGLDSMPSLAKLSKAAVANGREWSGTLFRPKEENATVRFIFTKPRNDRTQIRAVGIVDGSDSALATFTGELKATESQLFSIELTRRNSNSGVFNGHRQTQVSRFTGWEKTIL